MKYNLGKERRDWFANVTQRTRGQFFLLMLQTRARPLLDVYELTPIVILKVVTKN